MTSKNQRRHERIKHQANIQISAESEAFTFEMRDFSESGLYLFCSDTGFIHLQDQVKVQTLEFEGAPILDAIVVRLDDNSGFAVEFIQ
jgi:c-di-GMP-binding flagellar brake protein YcgR